MTKIILSDLQKAFKDITGRDITRSGIRYYMKTYLGEPKRMEGADYKHKYYDKDVIVKVFGTIRDIENMKSTVKDCNFKERGI